MMSRPFWQGTTPNANAVDDGFPPPMPTWRSEMRGVVEAIVRILADA
jgi:hypothetical protein